MCGEDITKNRDLRAPKEEIFSSSICSKPYPDTAGQNVVGHIRI
jgi:hypothetical protein